MHAIQLQRHTRTNRFDRDRGPGGSGKSPVTSGLPTTRELTIGSVNEAPLFVTNPDPSQQIGIRFQQAYPWRSRYTVEVLAPRE